MTTMDSDSESQDSDDGRRFRFEATRKDNAQLESKIKTKSTRQNSKHKSRHNDTDYKDRRERSRHESGRKEYGSSKDRDTDCKDNKDLRHATKYSKHTHESRSSRHEESNRDTKDASLTSKNSGAPSSKHKVRDSKRDRNRDRSEHRKHRSQERSHNRTEDDRALIEKHKNKGHEKYKRHSCDRSRDRGYQTHKVKSSEYGKSRSEYDRHNSHKKSTTRDDNSQNLKDNTSPKSTEQMRNDNETLSKGDLSLDSQGCKDLDLSEFDVLSETDENISDDSITRNRSPIPHHRRAKAKKQNLSDEHENLIKTQMTKSEENSEEYQKVNAEKNDPFCGSSNNNPSAVSDSLLGTAANITSERIADRMNDFRERFQHESDEDSLDFVNKKESSVDEFPLHRNSPNSSDEMLQLGEETISGSLPSSLAELTDSTYGPILPPILSPNSSVANNKEQSPCSFEQQTETVIEKNMKSTKAFIGPCLPQEDVPKVMDNFKDDVAKCQERQDSMEDPDSVFGPALPPHLLHQRSTNEADTKVMGPFLPSVTRSPSNIETDNQHAKSEDEDGIGPLPVDHPALKSNYVYKQLEQRAQKLKDVQKEEGDSILSRREEWMTELPPAQASNLGLGPRKFRQRAGPDMSDRSCWTDTPTTKAEKQRRREDEKLYNLKVPDTVVTKQSTEADTGKSRKREKSLLEIHQSKVRKKKKKEEAEAKLTGQPIRRPFDRDVDLKANQLDQAQKKSILRKAQLLEDRFSRGNI